MIIKTWYNMWIWRQPLKQQSLVGAWPKREALPGNIPSSLRHYGGFGRAFETEVALRRPFLWLPVAAGTGVVLYLYADREPSIWLIAPAAVSLGVLAYLTRAKRVAFFLLCGFCAVFAGELSAALRTARVAAPVIDKIRIVTLQGFIEEMDFRRNGARFILRVHSA
jgi:competence protein ComEC